jgi:hypothetical protein
MQTRIVKWWVGLNLEDFDRLTYTINADFKSVADAFDDHFLKTFGLKKKLVSDTLIVTSKYFVGDSLTFVLIGDEDPSTPESKSLLATVAFKGGLYTLSRSAQASADRDSLIWALTGKLQGKNHSIRIIANQGLDDPASQRAYVLAQSPSRSKMSLGLQFYRDMQRFHKALFILTIFILPITLGGVWYVLNLSLESYLSLLGTLAFFGLLEIGASIRRERKSRNLGEDSG